jgi:hypothetical protein
VSNQYQADTYILSWDMYGLESCINASQIDKEKVWAALKDENVRHESVGSIVGKLTLRARFNTQRHYEIYAIEIDSSITEKDLVDQFNQNPQSMADLVRSRGRVIYSDRVKKDDPRVVIT